MKSYLLGTFYVGVAILGIATKATADASIDLSDAEIEQSMKTTKNRPKPAAPPPMNSLEISIFDRVNQYRRSQNLPLLTIDPVISAQAKIHSDNMAKMGIMNHDGFRERAQTVAQTIVYRKAAENVAINKGYSQPDNVAFQGWLASPGHLHNITGSFDLTGIGVSKNAKGEYFFTQIFIRKAWYRER